MKLFFSLTIPYEDEQILESLDLPFSLLSDVKCSCSTEVWRSSYKTSKSCNPENIKQLAKETKANFIHISIKTKDDSNYWLKSLKGCLSVSPLNSLWREIKQSETKRRADSSIAYLLKSKKTNLKFQSINFFPSILELVLDLNDECYDALTNHKIMSLIASKLDTLSDQQKCIGYAYFLENDLAAILEEGPVNFIDRTITDKIKVWPTALPQLKIKFPRFYPFLFGPAELCKRMKKSIDKISASHNHVIYFQGNNYSGIVFSDEIVRDPRFRFHTERYANAPFAEEVVADSEIFNQLKPFLISLKGCPQEKQIQLKDYSGVICHDNGAVIGYLASEFPKLVASAVLPPLYDDFGLLEFPSPSFQKMLGVVPDDVLVYPENLRGIEFVEGKLKAKHAEISKTSSNITQNILMTYEDLTNGILMPYRDLFHKARELGLFDGNKQDDI